MLHIFADIYQNQANIPFYRNYVRALRKTDYS
jgi:hypothetical protein